MTSPSPKSQSPGWLEEYFGEDMLNFIYTNITRADILRQINCYNSDRAPAEHIFLNPTEEDSEIAKGWNIGIKWKELQKTDLSDKEALSAFNETIHVAPEVAPPMFEVPDRPGSSSPGDNVPPWLGMPGFEQRTTEWFAEHASQRVRRSVMFTDEGVQRQEELGTLKGTTIENSKIRLFDLLCRYVNDVQRGKARVDEEVGLVLDGIMAHAKGKRQMIDEDEPVEFTSLLEYQNSLLTTLRTREEVLMYSWWCYSKQCVATDTEIDEDVVVAAKTLIALTAERAEDQPLVLKELPVEKLAKKGLGEESSDLTGHETQETKAESEPVKTPE